MTGTALGPMATAPFAFGERPSGYNTPTIPSLSGNDAWGSLAGRGWGNLSSSAGYKQQTKYAAADLRNRAVVAQLTKYAADPDAMRREHPMVAGFLQRCGEQRLSEEEIVAGITKAAAMDEHLRGEFEKFADAGPGFWGIYGHYLQKAHNPWSDAYKDPSMAKGDEGWTTGARWSGRVGAAAGAVAGGLAAAPALGATGALGTAGAKTVPLTAGLTLPTVTAKGVLGTALGAEGLQYLTNTATGGNHAPVSISGAVNLVRDANKAHAQAQQNTQPAPQKSELEREFMRADAISRGEAGVPGGPDDPNVPSHAAATAFKKQVGDTVGGIGQHLSKYAPLYGAGGAVGAYGLYKVLQKRRKAKQNAEARRRQQLQESELNPLQSNWSQFKSAGLRKLAADVPSIGAPGQTLPLPPPTAAADRKLFDTQQMANQMHRMANPPRAPQAAAPPAVSPTTPPIPHDINNSEIGRPRAPVPLARRAGGALSRLVSGGPSPQPAPAAQPAAASPIAPPAAPTAPPPPRTPAPVGTLSVAKGPTPPPTPTTPTADQQAQMLDMHKRIQAAQQQAKATGQRFSWEQFQRENGMPTSPQDAQQQAAIKQQAEQMMALSQPRQPAASGAAAAPATPQGPPPFKFTEQHPYYARQTDHLKRLNTLGDADTPEAGAIRARYLADFSVPNSPIGDQPGALVEDMAGRLGATGTAAYGRWLASSKDKFEQLKQLDPAAYERVQPAVKAWEQAAQKAHGTLTEQAQQQGQPPPPPLPDPVAADQALRSPDLAKDPAKAQQALQTTFDKQLQAHTGVTPGSPEAQQLHDRWMQGKLSEEELHAGFDTMVKTTPELANATPEVQKNWWDNMSGPEKGLMAIGLGAGAIGLINMLSGDGGIGSMLMTLLGLGSAGAASGLFGAGAKDLVGGGLHGLIQTITGSGKQTEAINAAGPVPYKPPTAAAPPAAGAAPAAGAPAGDPQQSLTAAWADKKLMPDELKPLLASEQGRHYLLSLPAEQLRPMLASAAEHDPALAAQLQTLSSAPSNPALHVLTSPYGKPVTSRSLWEGPLDSQIPEGTAGMGLTPAQALYFQRLSQEWAKQKPRG